MRRNSITNTDPDWTFWGVVEDIITTLVLLAKLPVVGFILLGSFIMYGPTKRKPKPPRDTDNV